MPISQPLSQLLADRGVAFERLRPAGDGAGESMAAESALVVVDGRFMLAMVPRGCKVDAGKVMRCYRAKEVELSDEDELREVCGEFDASAPRPPFCHLCGLPVVFDVELCRAANIVIESEDRGGTAIRLPLVSLLKELQPRVLDIASPPDR